MQEVKENPKLYIGRGPWLGVYLSLPESVLGFGDFILWAILSPFVALSFSTCFALRSLPYEGGPGAMIPNCRRC